MKKLFCASVILLALLSGCGGGGNKSSSSAIGSVDQYANVCTPTAEKQWVRAHLDDVYLWYNEIPNLSPDAYNTAPDYFDALLVKSKDRFSFSESQAVIDQYYQSGADIGYGMTLVRQGSRLRVAYTEPNSPAAQNGINRGAEITGVNGMDIANMTYDQEVAALYPSDAGQTNSFQILDNGAMAPRTVQMTSVQVSISPVLQSKIFDTGSARIGYLVFNSHIATAEQPLIDAFTQFQQNGISDLVIDLRYNGGGYLYIASEVADMIGGTAVNGQLFEQLQFNDKHPEKTNDPHNKIPFFNTSTTNQSLPQLGLKRVFVLTGSHTCSASESIMNGLSPFVQVIRIGDTTCGKPYGMIQTNNCAQAYFAIQFKGVNSLGQADYADGMAPACSVPDDLEHQLGDASEARMAGALYYQSHNACAPAALAKHGGALPALDTQLLDPAPWRSNRILK